MNLGDVTIETFEPLVGSAFQVTSPDGETFELTLVKVSRVMERVRSRVLKRQPFTLLFQAPATYMLLQHTFEFRHPQIEGTLPIFLVPMGRGEDVFEYEAVFT